VIGEHKSVQTRTTGEVSTEILERLGKSSTVQR